jgi:hypothetical protein
MEPRVPTDMSSPADWSLIHAPIVGDTASASAVGATLTIAEALSALGAEVHAMNNVLKMKNGEFQWRWQEKRPWTGWIPHIHTASGHGDEPSRGHGEPKNQSPISKPHFKD